MCCIGCEVTSYSSETFMTQIIPHWSGPRADLHSTATQGGGGGGGGGGGHRYAHIGGGADLHRYGHARGGAQVRPHGGRG